MPYRYESSAARCPFYRMEDPKSIYCEGLRPGWGIIYTKDGHEGTAKAYKKKFCYKAWDECSIAKMLIQESETWNE